MAPPEGLLHDCLGAGGIRSHHSGRHRKLHHHQHHCSRRTLVSNALIKFHNRVVRSEKGATMVEYGLMVALIAVVCIGAVTALGTGVSGTFNNIVGSL